MKKEWKYLSDDYKVSNYGEVVTNNNEELPCKDKKGYKLVRIKINGYWIWRFIHSLVAGLFIGPRPVYDTLQGDELVVRSYDINHKDRDRGNNRVDNLEYLTTKDNIKYSINAGVIWGKGGHRYKGGWRNPNVKLCIDDVKAIRAQYAKGGISHKKLGELYYVSESAVRFIVNRMSWKEVE